MGDLCTDVACVRSAEALLVMVPGKRVLHCATEARHMQAVLVVLILSAARGGVVEKGRQCVRNNSRTLS